MAGPGPIGAHSAGFAQRNNNALAHRSANSGGAGAFGDDLNKGNDDLINFLEQKLEQ